MEKKYDLSLFIFRRDLRLNDNTSLIKALKYSKKVIPVFIITPEQIGKENKYRSNNCIQFMMESIKDLDKDLRNYNSKIYLFYGTNRKIVKYFIKNYNIDAIFTNMDYTPYAIKRDSEIKEICEKYNIKFITYEDYMLSGVEEIKTKTNSWFKKYTPYKNEFLKHEIKSVEKNKYANYYTQKIDTNLKIDDLDNFYEYNKYLNVNGGRENGLEILKNIKKQINYQKTRDYPTKHTTYLSAYIKFGCISIREVYEKIKKELGKNHMLIAQLIWHDFYTQISYHYPHVYGKSFQEKYDKIKWDKNEKLLKKWQEGKTGFPIVDAGMRQLNKIGWMHNRVRMIVASFLTKDLHIHWKEGEKYFATKLVDYSPPVNNGNWQWTASTGADSQPYFRIFNPWSQSEKHDKECEYIKKWIPELREIPNKHIHKWNIYCKEYKINYPNPIVDHDKESKSALKKYSQIK